MLSPKNIARIENSQFLQSYRLGRIIVLNMCFVGGDFQDIVIIVFQLKSSLSYVIHMYLKIPSEMEVALRYTLLTLFTLFILFKLLYTAETVACIQVYIVREYCETKSYTPNNV